MTRIALLLLFACHPKPSVPPDSGNASSTVPRLDATAAPSPFIPSVLHVSWTAPDGADSRVRWGLSADVLDQITPRSQATDVQQPILGLPADTVVFWQAVSDVQDQEYTSSIAEYTVPAPDLVSSLAVTIHDDSAILPSGYFLGSTTNGFRAGDQALTRVVIWRASDGVPVWWFNADPGVVTLSPSLSKHRPEVHFEAVSANNDDLAYRVRIDGMSQSANVILGAHHVVLETLPQQWAWLALRFTESAERLDGTDVIYQASFDDTASPTVLLDTYDDVFAGQPPNTCDHNQQPSPFSTTVDVYEWAHSNSLIYVPDTDDLYVGGRFVDSLWKVDRATGTLEWQLGGPNGDFTDPDGNSLWTSAADSRPWSHAHLTDLWDGGALLFDNGDHYSPRESGVVEVAWDEASRTAWEVWRYPHPNNAIIPIVGDARRLPEDHVLISWTTLGQVTEVNRDGDLLWEAQLPGNLQMGRVRYIPDLYALANPTNR
ncbi:MAG: hypothetical protein GWP91_24320 [Rhodobacterales bacterium]|nr:hypothetical protein [Rhodobacterales bacterium]